MTKDLTEGNSFGLLFKYALPMVGSAAFQQLYNIVDSVVAGQCIGDNALAAVGASYPVTMIYTAFALGINIGCSVVISQLFGGKLLEKMKTTISTALISSSVLCAILMILGFFFCKPILTALGTSRTFYADSAEYLYIYTGGLMFVFLYNICTGTFNALGDSVTPFIFLAASSIGNIIMDFVLVLVAKMGVAGVAWATFICQGIACVLAFVVLMKRLHGIKTDHYAKFSFEMLGKIAYLAIPGIIQQSFVSVGSLMVQKVVNRYDDVVVAGYSAAIKLNTFAITLFTTVSNSVSGFTAQNIGAGKVHRVKKGWRSGLMLGAVIVGIFFIAYFFFGEAVMRIFVKKSSTDTIQVGKTFLRIVSPFYFVVMVKLVSDGVLHGVAAVKLFMITTFTDLIIRVVLAFVLPMEFGYKGIWMSWPFGWTTAMIISVIFYFTSIKKAKAITN